MESTRYPDFFDNRDRILWGNSRSFVSRYFNFDVMNHNRFWGVIADVYGRKISFISSSIFIVVAGFLSCAAPGVYALVLFRFFVGVGGM